jgi:autotransporter-associated beta strand protein
MKTIKPSRLHALNLTARRALRAALTTFCLALATCAQAASLTWDANTGTTGAQDGSGTWNVGGPNNWWTGSANANFAANDVPTFGAGTDGTYAITVGGSFTSGQPITFNNSGYTLSAASARTITISGPLTVASGKTATIGTNVTLSRPSGGSWTLNGGGTLNINGSGATVTSAAGQTAAINAGTTVNVTSGSLVNNSSVVVGNDATGSPTLNVNGGSVSISGSTVNLVMNNAAATASPTITISSGSITFATAANTGGIRFGGNASGNTTGTLNLNGGTVTTYKVYEATVGTVNSTNNFNGGTLKALADNNTDFMTGLDRANVRNGGAIIDANGKSITIGQVLAHSNIGGDNATDGGLTLSGTAGTLTLTNANTYTGLTTVNAGELNIQNASAIGGNNVTVTAGRLALQGGITVAGTKSITINGSGDNFFGALQSASGDNTWAGSVTIGTTGSRIGANAAGSYLRITGNIGDGGNARQLIVRNNLGVTVLSGNNTYSGGTQVLGGELGVQGGSALYDAGDVNLNTSTSFSTIFRVSGSETIGTLSGGHVPGAQTSTVQLESGQTLTLSSGTQTFAGNIQGLGALTVNGANQTLTGANSYSGATTISAGTLALSGSGSISNTANITIASGATLDLAGLSGVCGLNGNLTTGLGALALAYGDAPAISAAGTVTLSSGTIFTVTNTGAQLEHGDHKLIAKTGAGVVTGVPSSYSITGGGAATPHSLRIVGDELYLTVNNAPVAKAITNGAPAGVTTTIRIIGGKPALAPTDADGDALLVSSVQNPSALLSATVTTDGTNIFYTPGLNSSGADTVQYVVSDGYGGSSTNTMYVTVASQSLNIVSGPTLTNNQFEVSFVGIPNQTYQVDDSTNSPTGPWAFYTNLTAGTNGLFQLVATNDPPVGSRFFRTRAQLP